MQEMVIYGVHFDVVGKQHMVLLKTVDGNRFLPIWIGHAEAEAIVRKLQGAEPTRPMTHDLLTDVLGHLEARVARITVTELRDNTFYALITLRVGASANEVDIDSRPSDAIAIAARANAPIFAADEVLRESAIDFPTGGDENESVMEEFKEFLDSVTPEDFAQ